MRMDYEIKKEIVDIAHMMNSKGIVGTYEGNISVRDEDRIYLTPSGRSKELLTEGQIIITDLQGEILEGQLKPTSETPMHTKCYQLRDDINAVVHCHPHFSTAYAQAGIKPELNMSPELLLLFGDIPIIPYGRPGTLHIIDGIEKHIKDYDVFLLEKHGVLAVGKTALEAFSKIMSLEMLIKTEVIRKIIAGENTRPLPEEECKILIEKGKSNRGVN